MAEMGRLPVELRLIGLFPALTPAEELLWRGMPSPALQDVGSPFFVAPVGVAEQALMTMTALPIGLRGGYLTPAAGNVSGALVLHLLPLVSMIVDIDGMPAPAAMGR
jgi:hypothetical protein